jgi:hypothetical protein
MTERSRGVLHGVASRIGFVDVESGVNADLDGRERLVLGDAVSLVSPS